MTLPRSPVIGIRELEFKYAAGRDELFNGLSHDFSVGKVTALTGPSGRGKSTLLFIIGHLLAPSSGDVLVDGSSTSHLKDATRSSMRAKRIGFVFQDSELDPSRRVMDSVLEPALYAGRHRDEAMMRAKALLTSFGLENLAHQRPGQVSGGQAQRLAVCRALINSPDIILADEPTGNLDRQNARIVVESLGSAAREGGDTVIIATHDPFVLGLVDEVLEL